MSLPQLVSIADFEIWLRTEFTDDQETWAEAVLTAASAKVRTSTGKTWVDDDGVLEDVPEEVQTVVKLVAARAWRNPTGVIHSTTGPFSARYAESVASVVVLTPGDLEMLTGHRTARPALFTVATTRGDEDPEGLYVDVLPPGKPLPVPDPTWW